MKNKRLLQTAMVFFLLPILGFYQINMVKSATTLDTGSLQGIFNYYAAISREVNLNPRLDLVSVVDNGNDTVTFQYSDGQRFTSDNYGFWAMVCAMVTQISDYVRDYSQTSGACPPPPPADTTPPTAPQNLTATAVSATQINLTWAASTDNVSVAGYKIFVNGLQKATTQATSYQSTGLSPNTFYTFKVSGYDAAGNNSAQSGNVQAKTQAVPQAVACTYTWNAPLVLDGSKRGLREVGDPADVREQVTGLPGNATFNLLNRHSSGSPVFRSQVRADSSGNYSLAKDSTPIPAGYIPGDYTSSVELDNQIVATCTGFRIQTSLVSGLDLNLLKDSWNYYAPISRNIQLNPRPDITAVQKEQNGDIAYKFSDGQQFTSAPQDFQAVVCSMVTQISDFVRDYSHTGGVCPEPVLAEKTGTAEIISITPNRLYLGEENTILIEGKNLVNIELLGADSAVSILEVAVSSDGNFLRAKIMVGDRESLPETFPLAVRTGGGNVTTNLNLAEEKPNAPKIFTVTVSPTEVTGDVRVTTTGQNLAGAEFQILGLPTVVVKDYSTSQTEIIANVTVLPVNPNLFGLIKRAKADVLDDNPGLIVVSTVNGIDAFSVDVPTFKVTVTAPASGAGSKTLAPTGFAKACSKGQPLAACIKAIYLLSLGLGAIIALLMIILSGYRYMTAAGNAQQVESAKEAFVAAMIGLIIIFTAFVLLYLINPDLVKFRDLPVMKIPTPP